MQHAARGWLAVACLLIAAWPLRAAAITWEWGELRGSFDSVFSISTSVRTEKPDCTQIATVNGGCNPFARLEDIAAGDADALAAEGTLLNSDDGNLNWDKRDYFSMLVKGTHELQLDWRNYGAFVRFSWFGDTIQARSGATQRTDLSRDARYRSSHVEGGVVGRQFLLLDAYLDGSWQLAGRYFNVRAGNQVINWGESIFAPGGLNSVNTLDVTKIRLPGSELKEALLPAPMLKVGGDIIGNLGFEAYYQFGWRKFDLDPVGSFFATSDLVSRGAQGQFQPLPDQLGLPPLAPGCGDPGPSARRREFIFPLLGSCPPDPSVAQLTRFPLGIPFLGFREADDMGQFGAALRYYFDEIETEISLHYVRLHQKFPLVSHRAFNTNGVLAPPPNCLSVTATPVPGCDIGYEVVYPEDIDLAGISFNTLIGGIAIGGELSYRWDQPTAVTFNGDHCSAVNPEACTGGPDQRLASVGDLLLSTGLNPFPPPGFPASAAGGGRVQGFTKLDRFVGMLNALYIFSSGTPYAGRIAELAGADDMTLVAEIAVTRYRDLDQCPPAGVTRGCKRYPAPFGVSRVDETGWGYTVRWSATYDRIFGTPISFLPVLSFSHDVEGITPASEAGFNEGVKSIGATLEFSYLQRWSILLSYFNSYGAGIRNADNDRDFAGASLSYEF